MNIVTKGKINREVCENCLVFYGHSQHSGTSDGTNRIEMTENIEKLYKTIDAKLQLLKFASSQTDSAIENGNFTAMERLPNTLAKKVEEVHDITVSVLELKFEAGEKEDEIQLWSTKLDEDVGVFETTIVDLDARVKQSKSASLEAAKKKEEDHAADIRERKYVDEMRFEKEKLEQRLKYEKQIEESKNAYATKLSEAKASPASEGARTKLPKLTIAKFNGSHTDWLRFWNIYEAEIDKCSDMAAVTKFAYLKDLLEPKVRAGIDGLPFSSEGNERAKNILRTKYRKTSEIVNAYVQNIMALPVISGANPARIHQFYEALSFNVQALETLGKLKEVNGYVRMSIDKLSGIRGDLVRTDENWQEWDFPKFVYALQGWTERNPVTIRSSDKPWRDSNAFNIQLGDTRPRDRACVYCDSTDHKPHECAKVSDPNERRKIFHSCPI